MSAGASAVPPSGQASTSTVPAMPTKADDLLAVSESSSSSSSLSHKSVTSSVATGNILQTNIDLSFKQQPPQQPREHKHLQLNIVSALPTETPMTEDSQDQPMEDATTVVVVGTSATIPPHASSASMGETMTSSVKENRQPEPPASDGPQSMDITNQQLAGDIPLKASSDKPDDVNGSQQAPQPATDVGPQGQDREEEGKPNNDGDSNNTPNDEQKNLDDDDDDNEARVHTAVFRPQLDDIMLDQDLLDFYQRLKELISRSPLKTAQTLYAFSAATSHLEIDMVKPSIFNMFHKTLSFYQDSTWFTVDLESYLELSEEHHYSNHSDLSSNSRIHILPTRHKLFPTPKQWNGTYNNDNGRLASSSSSSTSYASYLDSLYSYSPSHLNGTSRSRKRRSSRDGSPSRYSRYDDHERGDQDGRHRGRDRDHRERDRDDRSLSSRHRRHASTSPSQYRDSGETSSKRTRTGSVNDDGYGLNETDVMSRHSRYLSADGQSISQEERRRLKKKLKKQRRREEAERLAAAEAAGGEGASIAGASSQAQAPTQGYPGQDTLVANGVPGSHSTGDPSNSHQQYPGSHTTRPLKLVVRPPTQQPSTKGESGHQTPQTPVSSGSGLPRSILPNEAASDAAMRPPSTTPTTPKPDIPLSPHQIRRKGKHIGSAYSLSSLVPLPEDAAVRNNKPGAPPEEKLKKGTWTSQEEEMLLEAVRELSSENWHAVAARVPGRNAKQCMQKWQTDLDPQINRLPWTIDEDQRLVEAYQTYGNSWQQIAKVVETRTWYQCYNRVRAKSVKSRIMNAANFAAGGGGGAGAGAGGAGAAGASGAGAGSGDAAANGSSRGIKARDVISSSNRATSSTLPKDAPTASTGSVSRDVDGIVVKQEDSGPTAANVSRPNSTTVTPVSTHSQSPLSTPITPSTKHLPTSMVATSAPSSSPSTPSTAGVRSTASTPTAPAYNQFSSSGGHGQEAGRAPPPSHPYLQQQQPQQPYAAPRDAYSQHQPPQASKPGMEHGSRPSYPAPPQHHPAPTQHTPGGPVSASPTQPPSVPRMNQGQIQPPALAQQQRPYQAQQQQAQQQQQYRGPAPHSPHLQQLQQPGQRPPHAQSPTLPPQAQQQPQQQQRPASHQSPQMSSRPSHEIPRPAPPSSHPGQGPQTGHTQQQQQGAQGYHNSGQQGHGQNYAQGQSHTRPGAASSPHQGYQSPQAPPSSQPPGGQPPRGPQHSPYQQHPAAQMSPQQQPTQASSHLQQQSAHAQHLKSMSVQQPQQPQPPQQQPSGGHHRHNSSQGSVTPQQQQQTGYFTGAPGQVHSLSQPQPQQQQQQQQQPQYQPQDQQPRHHTGSPYATQGASGVIQQQPPQRPQPSFQPPPPISTTPGSASSSSSSTTSRTSATASGPMGGSFASLHRTPSVSGSTPSSGISTASPSASMAAPSPSMSSASASSSSAANDVGGGGANKLTSTSATTSFSVPMPSPSLSGLPPQLSPGALAFVPTSQLLKMTKSMQSPSATGFPPSNLPLRSPVSTQPPHPLPSPSTQNVSNQQGQQHQQHPQQQYSSASMAPGLNPYFQGHGRDHQGNNTQ